MELYILDKNYDFIGVIDEAESILWNKKYGDEGYCEIYVPCDAAMLDVLRKGNYVFRYDDDMICRIETVEIKTNAEQGDYIVATAVDMSKLLLAGRIVRWQIVYSGSVAGFIQKLLVDNLVNPEQATRRVDNFVVDDSNFAEFTETIEATAVTDDLYNLVQTTCKAHKIGFKVSFDVEQRQLVFRLYRGKNKASATGDEYVEFSPQFANILSSNYKEDNSNYKNVVYVGYTGTDEKQYLLSMHNGDTEPHGEERRELFVDGSSTSRDITREELMLMFPNATRSSDIFYAWDEVSQTGTPYVKSTYTAEIDGEKKIVARSTSDIDIENEQEINETITLSDYTFLLLIRAIGQAALDERKRLQEFIGNVDMIDTYVYKSDYDLGDIVKVKNEYGIEASARITEIMESNDNNNGYVIEPKFEFIS